jgi:hypothetical protein
MGTSRCRLKRACTLLAVFFFPALLLAQQPAVLDARSRAAVVDNISRLLLDNYVFPDTAVRMSARLRENLRKGVYNKITDPVAFSDRLNSDLRAVYHDRHMLVQYIPSQSAPEPPVAAPPPADPFQQIRQANFGLRTAFTGKKP